MSLSVCLSVLPPHEASSARCLWSHAGSSGWMSGCVPQAADPLGWRALLLPPQNQRGFPTRRLWIAGPCPPLRRSGAGKTLDRPSELHNTGEGSSTDSWYLGFRGELFWFTPYSTGSPLILLVHHLFFWFTSYSSGLPLILLVHPLKLLVHPLIFWLTPYTSGSPINLLVNPLYFWFTH